MKHLNGCRNLLLIIFVISFLSCKNKNESVATIYHDYSGCFASGADTITLIKENENLFATIRSADMQFRRVKLNHQQIDTFNLFISELKKLKIESGCTTVETYRVYYQNELIKIRDGGCDWRGFSMLQNCLFGVSN
ncbi:MAG: hypothetical protein QM737_18505 [Ferruginibacter sp.]